MDYYTGQSGHPSNPHARDMIDLWRNIQYIPMAWDEGSDKKGAVETLISQPN
jgi:acyl-homoserine lactone acylase PvdQ